MQKRWATVSKGNRLSKPSLQLRASLSNRVRRIVVLEKVAGSSPVGHPLIYRTADRDRATSRLMALRRPLANQRRQGEHVVGSVDRCRGAERDRQDDQYLHRRGRPVPHILGAL
jgi:hypothetical protein